MQLVLHLILAYFVREIKKTARKVKGVFKNY